MGRSSQSSGRRGFDSELSGSGELADHRTAPMSRRKLHRQHVSTHPALKRASWWVAVLICFSVLLSVGIGVVLLTNERATIGGVPVSIIMDFLRDETARSAYFQGDRQKLHDRLEAMGVEEEIKAFYRPQIRNEARLDRYIHQLLYNRTGHVGDAYQVNSQGVLTLKEPASDGFDEWFKLAREAGLVNSSLKQDGVQYVISPGGTVVPYEELAAIFTLEKLRSLVEMKQQ